MRIHMYSATSTGRIRQMNQDSLAFDQGLGFGIVADGMGGKPGGEIASSMVVESISQAICSSPSIKFSEVGNFMLKQIYLINNQLMHFGLNHSQYRGLGTTLDFLYFVGECLHLAHVGDSRTYVFYKNHLFQLTIDHNIKTSVTRGEVHLRHKIVESKGSRLTRGVGLLKDPDPDLYYKNIYAGEIYITASDGLFDMVSDKEIKRIIQKNIHRIDDIPRKLVDKANDEGGKDNTSILLSHISHS
ncbi:MAG: protein phosphatase 2C domain-containing protein [Proteobacteria bacterium]|nr:protein phosphatase 2C domain-containing protein [Pseudomonadota bacterium]